MISPKHHNINIHSLYQKHNIATQLERSHTSSRSEQFYVYTHDPIVTTWYISGHFPLPLLAFWNKAALLQTSLRTPNPRTETHTDPKNHRPTTLCLEPMPNSRSLTAVVCMPVFHPGQTRLATMNRYRRSQAGDLRQPGSMHAINSGKQSTTTWPPQLSGIYSDDSIDMVTSKSKPSIHQSIPHNNIFTILPFHRRSDNKGPPSLWRKKHWFCKRCCIPSFPVERSRSSAITVHDVALEAITKCSRHKLWIE
jgi:hypothetical protein